MQLFQTRALEDKSDGELDGEETLSEEEPVDLSDDDTMDFEN